MGVTTATAARRKRVERYFNQTPDPTLQAIAFCLMALGVLLVVGGVLLFMSQYFGTGLLVAAAGGVSYWQGSKRNNEYNSALEGTKNKPPDHELDSLLDADLLAAEGAAMNRLNLIPEDLELGPEILDPFADLADSGTPDRPPARPMVVRGPVPSSRFAIGGDGKWRFEQQELLVIFPTSYHLAMYRCVLDLRTGARRSEETQEYHYSDVVAVTTITRPEPAVKLEADDPRVNRKVSFGATSVQELQIVVSSGDRSKVVVGIWEDDNPDRQASLPDLGITPVIDSVRRVLRDKKGGTVKLT
jgi:hypothetical protein